MNPVLSSPEDSLPSTSSEGKRTRSEPKTYNLTRRYEKHKAKKLKLSPQLLDGETAPAYVFDNGAYTIKAGLTAAGGPTLIPNCIMKVKSEKKRLFIGNQIDDCRDLSGLFYLRPCEKGYITKWDVQKPIWDYVFSKHVCPIKDNPLVMTQPMLNFKNIEECTDEIFFEEYEIKALYRANPTDYAYYEYITKTANNEVPCVIIDTGFSFTHVVPYVDGKKYTPSVKRIDIGGKVLTNILREVISYRMYDVMEETHVINQVKEDACFFCEDVSEALAVTKLPGNKNTIVRNYVLPDFHTLRRGYIQDPRVDDEDLADTRQVLRLNNERFTIPEILFKPSDIEMKCAGIGETLVKSITNCPRNVQKLMCSNILVIGGNANFPGFKNRLYKEIRSFLPEKWDIKITIPDKPTTYAWEGARNMSLTPGFKKLLVTREEYLEHGSNLTRTKFNDQWTGPMPEIVSTVTTETDFTLSSSVSLQSSRSSTSASTSSPLLASAVISVTDEVASPNEYQETGAKPDKLAENDSEFKLQPVWSMATEEENFGSEPSTSQAKDDGRCETPKIKKRTVDTHRGFKLIKKNNVVNNVNNGYDLCDFLKRSYL